MDTVVSRKGKAGDHMDRVADPNAMTEPIGSVVHWFYPFG